MSMKELKNRGRSLLARVLIFSMMLCTLFYREVQTKKAEAATETGESLGVFYQDGSGAKVATTQSYKRYYTDEAANVKDETVIVTTHSSADLEDGELLVAWNVNGSRVTPGKSIELNWSEQVATASASSLNVIAEVISYTIEDSYNYFPVTVPGKPSVSYSDDTDTYTVSMPGTPTVTGGSFVRWKVSAGNGVYYADAGGTLGTEDGMPVNFSGSTSLSIAAEWVPMATINYYESFETYESSNLLSVSTQIADYDDAGNLRPLSVSVADRLGNSGGKYFLAWYTNSTYVTPGTTLTCEWSSLPSGYPVNMVGTWLIPAFTSNVEAIDMDAMNCSITVNTTENGYTVTAPAAPTHEAYFFEKWAVGDSTVEAGGELSDFFAYAGDQNMTFEAQWEAKQSAQIIFELNGGIFNNSTENIITTITQQSAEETSYYVTMPEEPTREGYIFDNWTDWSAHVYQPGESTEKFGISYSFAEEAPSFLAVWLTPKKATLTFDLAGGTYNGSTENVVLTITQASKSDAYGITTIDAPEKEGYVFEGWEVVVNGNTYTIDAGMTTEPFGCTYPAHPTLTLTALWTEEAEVTPTPTVTVMPTVSVTPSPEPTEVPESDPAVTPNVTPTAVPTLAPSVTPTVVPTQVPSATPTVAPTSVPSVTPTTVPSVTPSLRPTIMPTVAPTMLPSVTPTQVPTATATPTVTPSPMPTVVPTVALSPTPTATLTPVPTATPGAEPTATPTPAPEYKEVITISAGKMELVAGQKYVFAAGKWTINGDSTVYEGGMEFFVGATGNYVISEGE